MSRSFAALPLKIANAEHAERHVFVRDLELDGRVGVHGSEKGRAQPLRINIDLTVLEGAGPIEDALVNVVCYEQVVNDVKAILAAGHVNLVETLAERIAETCLEDPRVAVARIRVEKLAVIPEASSVGVEIERNQSSR